MCVGRRPVGTVGMRGDLAAEFERPGLPAALAVLTRQLQRLPHRAVCLIKLAGPQMGLREGGHDEGMTVHEADRLGVHDGALQQRHGFVGPTRQRVHSAERCGRSGLGRPSWPRASTAWGPRPSDCSTARGVVGERSGAGPGVDGGARGSRGRWPPTRRTRRGETSRHRPRPTWGHLGIRHGVRTETLPGSAMEAER